MYLPTWLRLYLRDRSFCYSFSDILSYRRALRSPQGRYTIHMKELGGAPMICRGGTSDAEALRTTFFNHYDTPPRPLPKQAVVLDLGSNVGYTIAYFKSLCPSARIIGVELDADNYALCLENTHQYSNCQIVHAGVWTTDGTISYGGKDVQSYAIGEKGGEKQVSAITVPTLLAKYGITHIDYVKMDIEGAELPVLKADPKWLDLVDTLRVEVHEQVDKHIEDSLQEVHAILTSHGFDCRKDTKHWSTLVAVKNNPSI